MSVYSLLFRLISGITEGTRVMSQPFTFSLWEPTDGWGCVFFFLFMDLISAQSVSVFFVLFPKLDVFLFICPSGFSPRSLSLVLDTFTTSWFISFYHLLTVNTVTGLLVLLLNDSGCVETHRRCLRWVDRGRNGWVMSLMISFSGRLVSKDNICTVQHMRENLFMCEFIMSWWFWLHLLSNVI